MKKSVCVLTALASFLVVSCYTNPYTKAAETEEVDDQPEAIVDSVLESERELKWMLKFVSPLMAILRTDWTINRRGHSNRSARSNRGDYYVLPYGDINHDRNRFHRDDYDRDGYGYGGGGGSYGCCDKKDDLLPLLALLALAGLLLYLIAIARKPVAARRSNKRSAESGIDEDSWIRSNDYNSVLLDGPTWLSMVHELWEQDTVLENTICTQETLCRMNRLAMSAPGQAGWAVSLSSLPLSYLLHTRHVGGFTSYMDAAMMGRSGANCTELYSSCPRLSH